MTAEPSMSDAQYRSPLGSRYASVAMREHFSERKKFTTWRRLWIALAEAEQELGLSITDAQLDELRAHVEDLDLDAAARYERELRHDVMAHVHAWGDVCPTARPIVHLVANGSKKFSGATRCTVPDATLAEKDACSACGRSKVYTLSAGRTLVRVTGMGAALGEGSTY